MILLKIIFVISFLWVIVFWKRIFRDPYSAENLFGILSPFEFTEEYAVNYFYIPCTNLKLYGHQLNKVYDNWHSFEKALWLADEKVLEIFFKENVILRITNPGDIEERTDRIVIRNAERINWEWNTDFSVYGIEILNQNETLILDDPKGLISRKFNKYVNNRPAIELIG